MPSQNSPTVDTKYIYNGHTIAQSVRYDVATGKRFTSTVVFDANNQQLPPDQANEFANDFFKKINSDSFFERSDDGALFRDGAPVGQIEPDTYRNRELFPESWQHTEDGVTTIINPHTKKAISAFRNEPASTSGQAGGSTAGQTATTQPATPAHTTPPSATGHEGDVAQNPDTGLWDVTHNGVRQGSYPSSEDANSVNNRFHYEQRFIKDAGNGFSITNKGNTIGSVTRREDGFINILDSNGEILGTYQNPAEAQLEYEKFKASGNWSNRNKAAGPGDNLASKPTGTDPKGKVKMSGGEMAAAAFTMFGLSYSAYSLFNGLFAQPDANGETHKAQAIIQGAMGIVPALLGGWGKVVKLFQHMGIDSAKNANLTAIAVTVAIFAVMAIWAYMKNRVEQNDRDTTLDAGRAGATEDETTAGNPPLPNANRPTVNNTPQPWHKSLGTGVVMIAASAALAAFGLNLGMEGPSNFHKTVESANLMGLRDGLSTSIIEGPRLGSAATSVLGKVFIQNGVNNGPDKVVYVTKDAADGDKPATYSVDVLSLNIKGQLISPNIPSISYLPIFYRHENGDIRTTTAGNKALGDMKAAALTAASGRTSLEGTVAAVQNSAANHN